MQTYILPTLIFFSYSVLLSVSAQGSCARDSCLSNVRQNHRHGGYLGCRAFLRQTVIPPDVTVTSTVTAPSTSAIGTVYSTSTQGQSNAKRDNTGSATITTSATAVPPHASAVCTDTEQYSSACSCVHVTTQTTTLSPGTVTVTATTTTEVDVTTTVVVPFATDCLPANIYNGPTNLQDGVSVWFNAGAAYGATFANDTAVGPIGTVNECCNACYSDSYCYAFYWHVANYQCDGYFGEFDCQDGTLALTGGSDQAGETPCSNGDGITE